MEAGKLSAAAAIAAVAVLAAMWLCKDAIVATITAPKRGKELGRLGWLKMRGMSDYVGRHRELVA
jgi:hypothetical protein